MTQPMPCRPDGEPIPCRGCQYFTGPGCGCDNEGHTRPQNPGPRPGLDEISSDDLDTLYDRADNAEAEVDRFRAQLTTQTQRAERAEATITAVREVALWIGRNYPGLDHDHRILAVLDQHGQTPA